MTKPANLTLTGLDAGTDLGAVNDLWDRYNEIEPAILYSPGRAERLPRFPSYDWIGVAARIIGDVSSLHLCGDAVPMLLGGEASVRRLVEKFGRVQLNVNHAKRPVDLDQLRALANGAPFKVILQAHGGNAGIPMHDRDAMGCDVAVLFDKSGGRGVVPNVWPQMYDGVQCGYAGGLTPENIARQIPNMPGARDGRWYWVDLESGLRDENDRFSLDKAEETAEAVYGPR